METDQTFVNSWIPTGVFFDLNDPFNPSFLESGDNIQGFSNAQMFDVFGPNIHDFCDYRAHFINQFPNVTAIQFNNLLIQNQHGGCNN